MKQITTQMAVLLSVAMLCVSGITIALIADNDCGPRRGGEMASFDRPPPFYGHNGQGMEMRPRHRGVNRNRYSFDDPDFRSNRPPRRGASLKQHRRDHKRQGHRMGEKKSKDDPAIK